MGSRVSSKICGFRPEKMTRRVSSRVVPKLSRSETECPVAFK